MPDSLRLMTIVGIFIGSATTALVALIGMFVTWRISKQTRKFDLRRAAVLDAVSHMSDCLDYFALASNPDVDDVQLASALRPFNAAMFKIHMVADVDTIAAVAEANQQLLDATLEISKRRRALKQAPANTEAPDEVDGLAKELLKQVLQSSLSFQRALQEANISARRELGMKLDEVRYRAITAHSEERLVARIDRAIAEASGDI